MKKLTMEEMIKQIDDSKKTNPLDLSSDQDLSVALMNLISLEEHFFFSGGKTGKTGFYDLIDEVRNVRKELMTKIVKQSSVESGEVWCISKHLLATTMRIMEVGTKALGNGNKKDAYDLFNKAYDMYSLFWGINMNLLDLTDVKKIVNDSEKEVVSIEIKKNETLKEETNKQNSSVLKRIGQWVKEKVNCCIE